MLDDPTDRERRVTRGERPDARLGDDGILVDADHVLHLPQSGCQRPDPALAPRRELRRVTRVLCLDAERVELVVGWIGPELLVGGAQPGELLARPAGSG